ncbi:MAG: prephenate dehydratase, partial [Tannerella sp.]|nr:prephenate dehydratase [Tannerella sp.]
MKRKVAIQGTIGSYHDIAAHNHFEGDEIEIIGCNTFRDVIRCVQEDASVVGLMAIENTIAGSLLQNHELIRQSGHAIIGEYKLRISHTLSALPGMTLQDVKEVNSHPIALMQCADFLDTLPHVKVVENEDTALSAKWIAENRLEGHAAICGKYAAEMYGLEVLAEGIETNKRNYTRFLAVADRWTAEELLLG